MPVVRFNYADIRSISLKNKRLIKRLILDLFLNERKILDRINYIFCSDNYLLKINQSFLKHDYYTDIITFDLSEGEAIVGEVYVSVDRVKENARQLMSNYSVELLRVIFHGSLHLCGYRDKMKSEITQMRQKEEYYLRKLL